MSIVDEFWAMSEVSDSQAESIIGVAYRGERFSGVIPGTEEEWGAWSNLTQPSRDQSRLDSWMRFKVDEID